MSWLYRCFRALSKQLLQLFFYRIKIEGMENIPEGAAVIFAPNHQNALLDPLLVADFQKRPIHFLTRSDVFNRWTRPILRKLNMMAIYRIRDGYAKLSQNDAVFEACHEVLQRKGAVLIFPEGNHGEHHYLRPLTKGIARLALRTQAEMEEPLFIQPVGLNFFEHRKPQSSVVIRYGNPLAVKDFLSRYDVNEPKALIELRDAVSAAMKETLIVPEETDDYAIRVDKIFQAKHESLSFEELKGLDIETLSVDRRPVRKHWLARLLNPIPFFVVGKFLKGSDDVAFHGTLKVFIGAVVFPLWWAVIGLALSFTVGIKIAALAVIVMVFGLFYSYQR